MRNKYAALLDLDGTLIDSLHIYYIAVGRVLDRFGVSCTYEEMFELAGRSGEELYTHFLKKNNVYDPSCKEEMSSIFDKNISEMLKDILFPNESAEVIKKLKQMGYMVAICTGASRIFVDTVIPADIHEILDSVVTCDDVKFGKPHPETFLMAADYIDIHPSNCIVVGDSMNDLEGSRRAGMDFILVRNKHNAYIDSGYVREINSIEELID